jgi:hypothetical protein
VTATVSPESVVHYDSWNEEYGTKVQVSSGSFSATKEDEKCIIC